MNEIIINFSKTVFELLRQDKLQELENFLKSKPHSAQDVRRFFVQQHPQSRYFKEKKADFLVYLKQEILSLGLGVKSLDVARIFSIPAADYLEIFEEGYQINDTKDGTVEKQDIFKNFIPYLIDPQMQAVLEKMLWDNVADGMQKTKSHATLFRLLCPTCATTQIFFMNTSVFSQEPEVSMFYLFHNLAYAVNYCADPQLYWKSLCEMLPKMRCFGHGVYQSYLLSNLEGLSVEQKQIVLIDRMQQYLKDNSGFHIFSKDDIKEKLFDDSIAVETFKQKLQLNSQIGAAQLGKSEAILNKNKI